MVQETPPRQQELAVPADLFEERLKKGLAVEQMAFEKLFDMGHDPEFIAEAGTAHLDFDANARGKHRVPDIRCKICEQLFEVRSSFEGVTMGHSYARPFWTGKPAGTLVVHWNPKEKVWTTVRLACLMATQRWAIAKRESRRSHPYLLWPNNILHPIVMPGCPTGRHDRCTCLEDMELIRQVWRRWLYGS